MRTLIINIDNFLTIDRKIVFFDKKKPTVAVMEAPYYEYSLLKLGQYKSNNKSVVYNGNTFWLPISMSSALEEKMPLENIGITVSYDDFKIDEKVYKLMVGYDEYYAYSFILNEHVNKEYIDDILKTFSDNYMNIKNLITFKPNLRSDLLISQFERAMIDLVYGISYNKKVNVKETSSNNFYLCDTKKFIESLNFSKLVNYMFTKMKPEDKKVMMGSLDNISFNYVAVSNNEFNVIVDSNKIKLNLPSTYIKRYESFNNYNKN